MTAIRAQAAANIASHDALMAQGDPTPVLDNALQPALEAPEESAEDERTLRFREKYRDLIGGKR